MKHKMMISIFVCVAVAALCQPALFGAKVIQSAWAAMPLQIDGSNADWEGAEFTEYKATKVDYAFRNDAENLYALFIFKSPREFMSSIRDTGMTVWLNAGIAETVATERSGTNTNIMPGSAGMSGSSPR